MNEKTKNSPDHPRHRHKDEPLSQIEQEKLLNWLGEGIDINTASTLFTQEFNREINPHIILRLWTDNSKKLHLARRNYFARLASAIVDGRFEGESALDNANAYLLKQTLFESLIEPQKDPKKIELLIKAIKTLALNSEKEPANPEKEKTTPGLDPDDIEKAEQLLRIL